MALPLIIDGGRTRQLPSATALTVQSAIDLNAAGTLLVGTTTATALTLGSGGAGGVLTTVAGDLTVTGNEIINGTSVFNGSTIQFGDAATDIITARGRFGDATDPNIVFQKEINHSVTIDASTTAATAGANLSFSAGAGNGAAGGNVAIDAGDGTVDGVISVGAANTSDINIGNVTNNNTLDILGTGQVSISGNVDALAGLDVTGALTVSTNITVGGVIDGTDDGTGIIMGSVSTGASTGSAPQVVTMTSTQRDDLVPANGMIIYNSTTGQFEGYDAAWLPLGAGGAISGTDSLTFTINQDAVAGSDEDACLALFGGDGGTELIESRLCQDSSTDRMYLWTTQSMTADTDSDRTSHLTLGPEGAFNATGNDADAILELRGHRPGEAVGVFKTATLTLDASAIAVSLDLAAGQVKIGGSAATTVILGNGTDNTAITQVGTGIVTFTGNVNATNGLDVTVADLTIAGSGVDLIFNDTDGTSHNITAPIADDDTDAGQLTITSQEGGANLGGIARSGGSLNLYGGIGGAGDTGLAAGNGANVWVKAGDGGNYVDTGVGQGGTVFIEAGATSSGSAAGQIALAGQGSTSAIVWGHATPNTTMTQTGTGLVTFTGNVDATAGLDVTTAALTAAAALTVTGGALTHSGAAIDLDPTGAFTLDMDAAQLVTVTLADATDALIIQAAGGEDFINLNTTAASEAITLGNATTNPDLTVLGSGAIIMSNGTLDVPAGTSFKIGTTALSTANFTAANVNTLLDGSNADALHIHSSAGVIKLTGLTTTGMASAGNCAYMTTTNSTVDDTDADAIATGVFVGVYEGTAGSITTLGQVNAVSVETGITIVAGDRLYLSTELGACTNVAPTGSGDVVAEIGVAIDGNGGAGVDVKALIRPWAPIEIA